MTARPPPLLLNVYAPALSVNDNRPLNVVHAMERAFPGLRLEWRISDDGLPIPLPQRDAWVAQGRADGPGIPLLCNGDESYPVTISGSERSKLSGAGGQAQFEVHAQLPLDAAGLTAAVDVLEGVAQGARAFWGEATPDDAALDIALQTAPTNGGPPSPPRGLPALKLFWDIRSPEIPYFLGWLNYWSAATARVLGFPDHTRDAELLSRARRTGTGGWLVQLTQAPLDLDNPSHLAALLRAYERFPEIGGRSTRPL